MALKMFIAAAEKFIAKCEDGRASSVVTYREMKAALALAKALREGYEPSDHQRKRHETPSVIESDSRPPVAE